MREERKRGGGKRSNEGGDGDGGARKPGHSAGNIQRIVFNELNKFSHKLGEGRREGQAGVDGAEESERGGGSEAGVWPGVGNILQAALMAVLKTRLLRNGHHVVYHGRLCSRTRVSHS